MSAERALTGGRVLGVWLLIGAVAVGDVVTGGAALFVDVEGSGMAAAAMVVGEAEHGVRDIFVCEIGFMSSVPALVWSVAKSVLKFLGDVGAYEGCDGFVDGFSFPGESVLDCLDGEIIERSAVNGGGVLGGVDSMRGIVLEELFCGGEGCLAVLFV